MPVLLQVRHLKKTSSASLQHSGVQVEIFVSFSGMFRESIVFLISSLHFFRDAVSSSMFLPRVNVSRRALM